MKHSLRHLGLIALAVLSGCVAAKQGAENQEVTKKREAEATFLPNAEASKVVSVTTTGAALEVIVVQMHAVTVKETGPKETVARFGEVYAFPPPLSPSIATSQHASTSGISNLTTSTTSCSWIRVAMS
jgi:hypothetical protein